MVTNDNPKAVATRVIREIEGGDGYHESHKGVDRLAADLSDGPHNHPWLNPLPELRKCVECGTMTAGSVGAAGIKWPMLCQDCKDTADAAALMSARRHARVADAIFRDDGDAFPGSLPLEPFDGVSPADGGGR